MNGGTYSEAVKVGFTPEQAGFLSRMGIEHKSEAVDASLNYVRKAQEQEKAGKKWWHALDRLREVDVVFMGLLAWAGLTAGFFLRGVV